MAQSLAKVYLHVIFSTKNRAPLLVDEWRDELFRVLGGAANNLGCQLLIVGGVEDHVHMLFQLARTITIADAVGKIKSTSSVWINQTRGLSFEFHWQAGYAAFSVSQSNVEAVSTFTNRRTTTRSNRFKRNCASGCGAMKSSGTNAMSGTDERDPERVVQLNLNASEATRSNA